MTPIPVNPELLIWARDRVGLDTFALAAQYLMCRGSTTLGGNR